MRECLSIHFGHTGCGFGRSIWKSLCNEHDIDPRGVLHPSSKRHHTDSQQEKSGFDDESIITSEANLSPFFNEKLGRYTPRAIFIDSDPLTAFDFDDSTLFSSLFNPLNLIIGRQPSTQNIYPAAIRDFASDVWEQGGVRSCKNILRHELEDCDYPTSFLSTQSSSGGAGGGIGNFVAEKLKQWAPNLSYVNLVQLPSPSDCFGTQNVLGICNSILTLSELSDLSQLSIVTDNESLTDIAMNLLEMPLLSFELMNDIAASVVGGLTCPIRFPYSRKAQGRDKSDRNVINAVNLELPGIAKAIAPIAGLPYIVGGFAPITSAKINVSLEKERPSFGLIHRVDKQAEEVTNASSSETVYDKRIAQRIKESRDYCQSEVKGNGQPFRAPFRQPKIKDLCWSLFDAKNLIASVNPYEGHFVKAMIIFRGRDVIRDEVIRQITAIEQHSIKDMFEEWINRIPRRCYCHAYQVSEPHLQMSATFFGSVTSISNRLDAMCAEFDQLTRRRAFIHKYLEAGLDLDDLIEARRKVMDVSDRYKAVHHVIGKTDHSSNDNQKHKNDPSSLDTVSKKKFLWP